MTDLDLSKLVISSPKDDTPGKNEMTRCQELTNIIPRNLTNSKVVSLVLAIAQSQSDEDYNIVYEEIEQEYNSKYKGCLRTKHRRKTELVTYRGLYYKVTIPPIKCPNKVYKCNLCHRHYMNKYSWKLGKVKKRK